MYQTILEWILPIVGAGGLGSAITYMLTIKSKKRIVAAEAEGAELEAKHKKMDLQQDQCDYLQKQCDKYITDYHTLELEFRARVRDLQEQLTNIMVSNQREIQEKCVEIATLKSKITYLKGIRCHNFTCPNRIQEPPSKS